MKLISSKTKTMVVSMSRTMHPQSLLLTIGGIVLNESDDLDILRATFESTMTFEKHLRLVSTAASQRFEHVGFVGLEISQCLPLCMS